MTASLPTSYLRLLLQATGANDARTRALVAACGLETHPTQAPLESQWPLLEHLLAQYPEPRLGWQLGLQMQLALHGQLGTAFYSAADLGSALQLLERYLPVRAPVFSLSINKHASGWWLQLEPRLPLKCLSRFLTHTTTAALCSAISSYTGAAFDGEIQLPQFEPSDSPDLFHPYADRIRLGSSVARLFLNNTLLTRPSLMSDAAQHALALALCEQALQSQGQSADALPHILMQWFSETPGQRWTQDQAATHLHMSSRTLNRRLRAIGTSFHHLQTTYLHRCACQLLNNPQLSVDAIALQLGFHDGASFRRSFKRWQGTTPSGYRAQNTPPDARRGPSQGDKKAG